MHDGVACPVCASVEEQREGLDVDSTGLKESKLPYGWGKLQAGLLIVSGLRLLDPDSGGLGFSPFDAAFNLALGVCILRRNRLILPLMIIAGAGLILEGIVGVLTHNPHDALFLAFAVVIWALCAFYYYNRRHEFKRWF